MILMNLTTYSYETTLPHGPVDHKWVQNAVSSQFATLPILESISEFEVCQLIMTWSGLSDLHNGNVTYFIDGLTNYPIENPKHC